MTGEIHIISKIFLINTTILSGLLMLRSMLNFYDIGYGSVWIALPAFFLYCYIAPLVLVPLFCTQLIFWFKEQNEDSGDIEASYDSLLNKGSGLEERLL